MVFLIISDYYAKSISWIMYTNLYMSDKNILDDRYNATDVLERVLYDADEEISRGNRELLFSALAAGIAITITLLLYSTVSSNVESYILGSILYPLGFIYIIIGNYQLYTENTLPPVALTIEKISSVPSLLKMWIIILFGNLLGSLLGSLALFYGNVLSDEAGKYIIKVAQSGVELSFASLFFKGMFAGIIVAGVVWMDFSVKDSISRVILVYLAFLSIPLGNLYHVVVSTTEMFYLILATDVAVWSTIISFPLPVLLGNTIGGVLFVTLVNYFQTPSYVQENSDIRLDLKEWLTTWCEGREHEKFE